MRTTTSIFPKVLVTLREAMASLRSRISVKYSSTVLACLRVIWTLKSPLPGLRRTRATALLRRPVPHHQPCVGLLGSGGHGDRIAHVEVLAGGRAGDAG